MKIAIGGDHAGFEYKAAIIELLVKEGHTIQNFGTDSADSVDYPDFAHQLAAKIEAKEADYGILICGTANGIAMSVNKHEEIRAAIAWSESVAYMARQHNDANVLCLPARYIAAPLALSCVDLFMSTDFEGGRHKKRVDKI